MKTSAIGFFAFLLAFSGASGFPKASALQIDTPISWREDFNGKKLDNSVWEISNTSNIHGSIENNHQGNYLSENVTVSKGKLRLKLTQQKGQVGTNPQGIISYGGEIHTKQLFGYGTYKWRMKIPKGVTGSVAAGFIYNKNSGTEIDFEVEGQKPDLLRMTTWHNPDLKNPPKWPDHQISTAKKVKGMSHNFKTYKLVWTPEKVSYYVNSKLFAEHTENIPQAPGRIIINFWGTNRKSFGGKATVGKDRFLFVNWVRFTPL